jgi:hypothetical protein
MNYKYMILIALVGVISGTIGTLILLPFKWYIEQKKLRYHARKDLLLEIRNFLASNQYNQSTFGNTAEYSKILPHLSQPVIESIEGKNTTIIIGRGGEVIKTLVLDDLARLEKKWKII